MLEGENHLASSDTSPAGVDAVELSVLVPCLNEELNVPELVERIFRLVDPNGMGEEISVLVQSRGMPTGSAVL